MDWIPQDSPGTVGNPGSRFYRPRERPKPTRRPGLWLPVLVAIVGMFVYVFVFGESGVLRERQLRGKIETLETEIEALHREGAELEAAIAELEAGGPEVERLGREQLGLIKKNEISYRLVPTTGNRRGLDSEEKNR